MKATYTPNAPKSSGRIYPCYLKGKGTNRIILAINSGKAILLVSSNNGSILKQQTNTPLCFIGVDNNEFADSNCWAEVEGTITIELP